MIIAFQILMLFIIFTGFMLSFSKEYDSKTKTNSSLLSVFAIAAFLFTLVYF